MRPTRTCVVNKLITLGQGLSLGWRLEQTTGPFVAGNPIRGDLGAARPGLRWVDFWASYDPAPAGPLKAVDDCPLERGRGRPRRVAGVPDPGREPPGDEPDAHGRGSRWLLAERRGVPGPADPPHRRPWRGRLGVEVLPIATRSRRPDRAAAPAGRSAARLAVGIIRGRGRGSHPGPAARRHAWRLARDERRRPGGRVVADPGARACQRHDRRVRIGHRTRPPVGWPPGRQRLAGLDWAAGPRRPDPDPRRVCDLFARRRAAGAPRTPPSASRSGANSSVPGGRAWARSEAIAADRRAARPRDRGACGLPSRCYSAGLSPSPPPRSWSVGPDRPSDGDRLAILPEHLSQDAALLAERRVRLGAAQEVGHQVGVARFRAGRRVAQTCQARPPRRRRHGPAAWLRDAPCGAQVSRVARPGPGPAPPPISSA